MKRILVWQAPQYWRRAPDIEVYSMITLPDGSSTLYSRLEHGPEAEADVTYDVLVRFPGDDPLEEVEDIPSFQAACIIAAGFQRKYKVNHIEEIIA